MNVPGPDLDLPAYLARIGWSSEATLVPTLGTLRTLHRAHALAIPFENLDIQLGAPIRLDLASLQAKLVAGRRGGYCFEQNALFAAVLERLGFEVTRLAARVWMGPARPSPRTHMLLRVQANGVPWLADVGFGSDSLLEPIPMLPDGSEHTMGAWAYRLRREPAGDLHVLQSRGADGAWLDLYAFSLEPQLPIDYEVANHYTSTHPASRFILTLTAQRVTDDVRYILRNRDYEEVRAGGREKREIGSPEELLVVLAETFGLRFPAGTTFRQPQF